MNYIYDGVSLQNKRQANMDSLLLKYGTIHHKDALLAVVCDGVGSLENGGYSSGTAVRMLSEWFDKMTDTDRIGLRLRDEILQINNYIAAQARHKKIETASTLSALLLVEMNYYAIHIGDSRIYCYENEVLSTLTNDDVSQTGKLSAFIGYSDDILLQYYEGVISRKVFLICTDGLYRHINVNFLTKKVKSWGKHSTKELLEVLAQCAVDCGEKDNITLALIKTKS